MFSDCLRLKHDPSSVRRIEKTTVASWRDNVFVERLWKSIKYEEVYLRAYETVSAAHSGIARYIDFYNNRRPHSSLDGITPDAFSFKHLPAMQNAA